MHIFDSKCKELISEGLIRSYGVDVYKKLLQSKFQHRNLNIYINDGPTREPTSLRVQSKYPLFIDPEFKRLNQVCGYSVIGHRKIRDYYDMGVEKVFSLDKPLNFSAVANYFHGDEQDCRLYHVTPSKLREKIMKIGLTPRSTKSGFKHAGNRIYLFFSFNGDIDDLRRLGAMIYQDRIERGNQEIDMFGDIKNDIYEIIPNEKQEYYFDPSLTISDGFEGFGVYTFNNIPPNQLRIIESYDPESYYENYM